MEIGFSFTLRPQSPRDPSIPGPWTPGSPPETGAVRWLPREAPRHAKLGSQSARKEPKS